MALQQPIDSGLRELALFAGAGGGILGGKLLGWRTVCAVEFDAYARSVLMARQNDGCLEPFPIWDDVRTFDGTPWRGRIDVVSGGFPCQDISVAGTGKGISGERSGLWREMARIIGEVGPRFVLVENSPALTARGLGTVLGDLATLGYDARWGVLGAVHAGAPHKRERIWIVANARHLRRGNWAEPNETQPSEIAGCGEVADSKCQRLEGLNCEKLNCCDSGRAPSDAWAGSALADTVRDGSQRPWKSWFSSDPAENEDGETDHAFHERVGSIWGVKSPVGRVANGVANRMDRLKAIGNGQVPSVAALAWHLIGQQTQ